MKLTRPCNVLISEYREHYKHRKLQPVGRVLRPDCFNERVKDWEIDPILATATTESDAEANEIVRRYRKDLLRSVYKVSYKDVSKPDKQKHDAHGDRELLTYIQKLYSEHTEKVVALPVTAKRMLGYVRPEFLHGGLSMYQDTYGRAGGLIMLRNAKESVDKTGKSKTKWDARIGKTDICQEFEQKAAN